MRALRAGAPVALVFCLMVLTSPARVGAQSAGSAGTLATVISQDGLNLRQSPSMTSAAMQIIPYAAVVTLTGTPTADHWYPVMWGTVAGWANGDYLAAGSLTPDAAKNAASLKASAAAGSAAANPTTSAGVVVPPATPPVAATTASASGRAPYRATATYYGIDDGAGAGKVMACGAPFDPMNAHAAATNDWSCGTKLRVTGSDGKSVDVVVSDHGVYPAHWMDLTYAAFGVIADHKVGTIQVTIEVLQ